jgi:hypothetical protein
VPKVEYIPEREAPAPPKPMTKSAQESLAILQGLKEGQVARVTPDKGRNIRGLKASLSRVATSQKLKIQSYEVPDEPGVLYIRKSK